MGLRGQVVDLIWLDLREQRDEPRAITQVPVVKEELGFRVMRVYIQVVDPMRIEGRSTANETVHLVPLRQEQLGEVRTILARDARDKRAFCHMCPPDEESLIFNHIEAFRAFRPEPLQRPTPLTCVTIRSCWESRLSASSSMIGISSLKLAPNGGGKLRITRDILPGKSVDHVSWFSRCPISRPAHSPLLGTRNHYEALMSKNAQKGFNRRTFILTAGLGLTAVGAASPTPAEAAALLTVPSLTSRPPGAIATAMAFDPTSPWPDAIRAGRKLYLGDVATWSPAVYQLGAGAVTLGNDPVAGDYVRLLATNPGAPFQAGRDMPLRLDEGKVISFLLRRNDANLAVFDLYAGYGRFNVTSPSGRWNKSTGAWDQDIWRRVVFHPKESDGGIGSYIFDTNDFRSLAIRITPSAGSSTSIDIADIRIHDGVAAPGQVSIMFDDARLDTFTVAYPLLAAKGYRAGVAVEHTTIGGSGPSGPGGGARCSMSQLQELYAAGWDMHGHHTSQMTFLSETDQVAVHRASKGFLSTNGFLRGDRIWVWPGGTRNATAEAIALRYWQTLRRVSAFTQMGTPHLYDPADPPLVYATVTHTLARMQDRIDRLAISGGHVTIVFHSLVSSVAATEDWLVSDFKALLDYIEVKGVKVVPASEVWTL